MLKNDPKNPGFPAYPWLGETASFQLTLWQAGIKWAEFVNSGSTDLKTDREQKSTTLEPNPDSF